MHPLPYRILAPVQILVYEPVVFMALVRKTKDDRTFNIVQVENSTWFFSTYTMLKVVSRTQVAATYLKCSTFCLYNDGPRGSPKGMNRVIFCFDF